MIELTSTQRQSLAATPETPPVVIDPETQTTYVLLRKDVYDRFKNVFEEDDARVMAPLLADLDPEDWEDAAAYEGRP
jgi:hypothetical protein